MEAGSTGAVGASATAASATAGAAAAGAAAAGAAAAGAAAAGSAGGGGVVGGGVSGDERNPRSERLEANVAGGAKEWHGDRRRVTRTRRSMAERR